MQSATELVAVRLGVPATQLSDVTKADHLLGRIS
jgi:hypothetical protein